MARQLKSQVKTLRLSRRSLHKNTSLQAEHNGLGTREEWATHRNIENSLAEHVLVNNVIAVVTTLVNSGNSILKKFESAHTVVQEAGKVDNTELFIAMANS